MRFRLFSTAGMVTAPACLVERTPTTDWTRVSAAEFAREMEGPRSLAAPRLTIVDVREPELFAAGHIPSAINIPYPEAKARELTELDPSHQIVFVCHGGPMGDELAEVLAGKGFTSVRNLAGGMGVWRGPVVAGGDP